jgi:hypothetical protein
MDLFVVPTVSFRLLYGLLIMGHGRRQVLWHGVTAHPTTEWIANQLTQAYGWKQAPRFLILDRDSCYGTMFTGPARRLTDKYPQSEESAKFSGPYLAAYTLVHGAPMFAAFTEEALHDGAVRSLARKVSQAWSKPAS